MKLSTFSLTALLTACAFIRCSDDQNPDPRVHQVDMLASGAWITESVINSADGDLTTLYQNFTIVFLKNATDGYDGDYYVSEGGRAFPAGSGKWKLSEDLSTVNFSDGRSARADISDASLTLVIGVASTNGRIAGLSGQFTFTLKRRQ